MDEGDLRNMKIVIDGDASLKKWCQLLDCKEKDLLDAIRLIGNAAGAVDDYLYMNLKKKSMWDKYNEK